MKDLISVIIPVYNVELYLEHCVRSVMGQTYSNIEIILVDDGSTDGSGKLCDMLASEDSRIHVFHKPNGGVSSARNLGAQNCRGNYIAFVDSDDYVDSRYIEYLYDLILRYQADVAQCKAVTTQNCQAAFKASDDVFCVSHDEIVKNGFDNVSVSSCWGILAGRELVLSIPFPENYTIGEDTITTFKRFANAHKIAVGSSVLYAYFERPGSAFSETRNGNADPQLISCLKEAALWSEAKGARGLSDWAWRVYTVYTLQYTTVLKNSFGCFDQELEWVRNQSEIWKRLPVGLRRKVSLYLVFPKLYLLVKKQIMRRREKGNSNDAF